jgi:hypothetical protein
MDGGWMMRISAPRRLLPLMGMTITVFALPGCPSVQTAPASPGSRSSLSSSPGRLRYEPASRGANACLPVRQRPPPFSGGPDAACGCSEPEPDATPDVPRAHARLRLRFAAQMTQIPFHCFR